MFIGHYAAAPLAAATGKVKLWQAFIAVQLVDYIWALLNLAGIEKARIVAGFTPGSPMDLHFMPYSHSLFYTLIWAGLAGGIFLLHNRCRNAGGAILIALLVISHWIADVIVHVPDMTLYPGSDKIGLGLWNNLWLSLPLEIGMMIGALWVYVRLTFPASGHSFWWNLAFAAFLIALQVVNTVMPPPQSIVQFVISALLTFTVIALIAGLYERTRHLHYELVDNLHEPI